MKYSSTGVHAIIAAVCFLLPASVYGVQVDHHGFKVDTRETALACLSCHDGAVGKAVSYCTTQCEANTSAHPILKPYPPKRNRNRFAPTESVLSQGIALMKGRITCISCHDLKNREKWHLAASGKGKLCSICHIK